MLSRPDATYSFHAGQRYREFLIGRLPAMLPFEGLGTSKQLAWYDVNPVTVQLSTPQRR